MFKSLRKISNRTIIICIFLFNLIILISFSLYILIGSSLISNNLLLLAYPAKILSENIFYLIFFFIFEFLSIGYFWVKKFKTKNAGNDKIDMNLATSNIETNNLLTDNIPDIAYEVDEINYEYEENDAIEDDNSLIEFIGNDERDISPSFISPLETTVMEKPRDT
ncbi:MAG: hypothetical protein ACFFDW_02940, partial [Candidatus Thorarchaeota archaeon]